MLTAYLTPAKVQTLKKSLSPASDSMALYNVLLLSPSLGYSMRNGHVQIMPPKMYWTQDNKPTVSSTASSVKVSTCQDSVEQMTDCAQYLILEPSQEYYGDTFLANGQSLRNERKRSSLHLKTHNPETLPLPHPELLEIQAKLGQAFLNFFTEQFVKTNGAILSESDPSSKCFPRTTSLHKLTRIGQTSGVDHFNFSFADCGTLSHSSSVQKATNICFDLLPCMGP